jgi:hypothetical protein
VIARLRERTSASLSQRARVERTRDLIAEVRAAIVGICAHDVRQRALDESLMREGHQPPTWNQSSSPDAAGERARQVSSGAA